MAEIGEGLRLVFGHPLPRALAGCGTATGLLGDAFLAIYVLFMARNLGLGPAAIGLVLAAGGLDSLLGALLAPTGRRGTGSGRRSPARRSSSRSGASRSRSPRSCPTSRCGC